MYTPEEYTIGLSTASATQGLLSEGSEARSHVHGSGNGEPGVQASTDNAWAIAFKLNVVFTFLLAIYGLSSAHDVGRLLEAFGLLPSHILTTVLIAGFFMVPLTYGISWILLSLIGHCAKWMVEVFGAFFLVLCYGAVTRLFDYDRMLAAELAFVCGLTTFLVYRRRGSIEFAASNLKAAALCVKCTPNIMLWALYMMVIRTMWYAANTIALIGLAVIFLSETDISDISGHTTGTATELFSIFLPWKLSAVWQYTVTGKVIAATVASSVSSWCSSPGNVEPVRETFRRVFHNSLGSLCKAAMTESIIAVIVSVVGVKFIHVGAPILPVVCVWLAARYAAQYTVLFVGMYQLDYSEGAGRALAILRTNGLTILLNNTLVVVGCFFPIAMVAFVLGVVHFLFSYSSTWHNLLITVFLRVLVAAIVVTFEVAMNSFMAVFVYFMQDPEAFAEVHGFRDQDGVYRAWRRMHRVHPEVEEDEGGNEF